MDENTYLWVKNNITWRGHHSPTVLLTTMDLTRYNKEKENIIIYLILLFLIGIGIALTYKPYGFIDPEYYSERIAPSISYNFITMITAYIVEVAIQLLKYHTRFARANTWWKFILFNQIFDTLLMSVGALAMALNLMNCIVPLSFVFLRSLSVSFLATFFPYAITLTLFAIREKKRAGQLLDDEFSTTNRGDDDNADSDNEGIPSPITCMFYNLNGKFVFSCKEDDLLYVESNDNYVNIHYLNEGNEEHTLILNTMKNLETTMASHGLLRCHRSFLVNSNKIKTLRRQGGAYVIELEGSDTILDVGKTYQESVISHTQLGKRSRASQRRK